MLFKMENTITTQITLKVTHQQSVSVKAIAAFDIKSCSNLEALCSKIEKDLSEHSYATDGFYSCGSVYASRLTPERIKEAVVCPAAHCRYFLTFPQGSDDVIVLMREDYEYK